jgi:hypothetical protein
MRLRVESASNAKFRVALKQQYERRNASGDVTLSAGQKLTLVYREGGRRHEVQYGSGAKIHFFNNRRGIQSNSPKSKENERKFDDCFITDGCKQLAVRGGSYELIETLNRGSSATERSSMVVRPRSKRR